MGAGDFMPTGHHHHKADPARAKKIREGGKRAEAIKHRMETHHQAMEEPAAEEELMQDLKKLN